MFLDSRSVLLTPGPVAVQPLIIEAMTKPLIFHRYGEFQSLFSTVNTQLHRLFNSTADHKCFVFTGSGTLANEIILSSVFSTEDRVVVVSNGDFGERLMKILELHGIQTLCFKLEYFQEVDAQEVLNFAVSNNASAVALVGLETSTGMSNPIAEVGRALMKSGANIDFFVDAVSAFGCKQLDVSSFGISYCTSVLNKALEGPPGLSFACVDMTKVKSKKRASKSYYLDLFRYADFETISQTPTTPAIPQIQALHIALKLLEEETITGRMHRYSDKTNILLKELCTLGFNPTITNIEARSCSVTVFSVPAEINVEDLRQYLLNKGFVVWFPPNHYTKDFSRLMIVSVMGAIEIEDVIQFVNAIRDFHGIVKTVSHEHP